MTTLTEADVQAAALAWLAGLGWGVARAAGIAPGSPGAVRGDYGQVVLERRLRDLMYLAASAPANIEWLARRADGAAHPAVRPQVVGRTQVAIPAADTDMLDWFSTTAGSILDKMEWNKMEPRARAAQRDALLPGLVSGEVGVGDAKRAMEVTN